MATTFSGLLSGSLIGSYDKTSDLTTRKETIAHTFSSSYSNGTSSNQANAFYSDTRTLAATSESFDLNAASTVDGFGDGLVFTKVKYLYVKNKSTTAGQNLVLSGDWLGATTGPVSASGTVTIGPGGIFILDNPIDGYTVGSAATQDVLTVTNTATFDYDILIVGTI